MKIEPYSIKLARENVETSLAPSLTNEIIACLNERIKAASKTGQWYTDCFYTYWNYIDFDYAKQILEKVKQRYKDEGYCVNGIIKDHIESKLTLYFTLNWEEVAQ